MKTVERTAVCGGCGSFLFYGKFEDGRCFFFDNVLPGEPYLVILDEMPDADNVEQMRYEWIAAHTLDILEGAEGTEAIIPILMEILQYGFTMKHDYNVDYIMDEIERYGKEYFNLLRKSS